ncbi:hypothetical protein [Clostridium cylindrosporum]|uniref:Uncharacterized protein n=1 Tax=Clostridium cylindrosporum DSM 605 TaxID=1121307 RepID=A0A0J8DDL9_CLOCY|nr:hypothetical protein [Clostridium cylindrosporum]KMT22323.1 hypothetical protein CLCY_16c00020 [Clostridium cylindrosporum DSM 605]
MSNDKLIQIVNELGANNVVKLRSKIEKIKNNNDFSKLKKILEIN